MSRKKILIICLSICIVCIIVTFVSKVPYVIVGNTYEGGRDVDVVIILNDKDTLYEGTLTKNMMLFDVLKKKEMKIGLYKVSAYVNSTNKESNVYFFYLFQDVIWIDFDMKNENSLLVMTNYGRFIM